MDNENLKQLLEYLADKNLNVTINFNINENRGLTAEQVEEARAAGREGREIRF